MIIQVVPESQWLESVVLNIVYFQPDPWGDDSHFDEHIFQMGGSTTN